MAGITNRQAHSYVIRKEPFKTGNGTIFGVRHFLVLPPRTDIWTYTVYSYRDSWPMFVFDSLSEQWFETAEKAFSRTTARHLTHCRPMQGLTKLDINDLHRLSRVGYTQLARERLSINEKEGMTRPSTTE